ncbi:MAG TPA: hypothetical protein VNT60_01625, partial [Deinococcales bacterium]|nr:hypothetical protein [Deinococcales bacterium]
MLFRGIRCGALLALAAGALSACGQTAVPQATAAANSQLQEIKARTPGGEQPLPATPGLAAGLVGIGGQPGIANGFAADPAGRVVAATDGGALLLEGSAWRVLGTQALPGPVSAVASDGSALVAGVSGPAGGAFRLTDGAWSRLAGLPQGGAGVTALIALGDGSLVAATGGSDLYRLQGGAWSAFGPGRSFARLGALA